MHRSRRLTVLASIVVLAALALATMWLAGERGAPPAGGPPGGTPRGPKTSFETEIPPQARAILAEIERRGGEPPPGHVGGRTFHNRERKLPPGTYREYDVNPKVPGRLRDAERIVVEQRTGKAYYTGDHYRTFVPMN